MSSKVLGGEGLVLRPQHFQQQDRYHEQGLHKSIKAVHPYDRSVDALQVDREALASSMPRLVALSVRFQDGDLLEAPAVDLSLLPPSLQSITCYIALPGLKPFSGNAMPPGQATSTARFVQANLDTPDLYTQAAPVQLPTRHCPIITTTRRCIPDACTSNCSMWPAA
jgi:type VI secretion system protein ImpJ